MQVFLGIDRGKCITKAKENFRSVISRATQSIQVKNMAQLNLGTLLDSDSPDESLKMYTEVIESKYSSEETKACALNNRASIYQRRKDHKSAIADRRKVFDLKNTSSDRRFVALLGCGESYYSLEKYDEVVYYMTEIIETEDIEKADKICARIVKAASSYFEEVENFNAVKEFAMVSNILVRFISEKDLKNPLVELINDYRPINWDEVNTLLTSIKEKRNNSAIDLLVGISRLLTTNYKKSDKRIKMQEVNNLINIAISNAKRMRVSYPEVN